MPALVERFKPRRHKLGLRGISPGLRSILLVISDRRVGVLPLPGDFTQPVEGAVSGGISLKQILVVDLRGVQAPGSQIGGGAVEPGRVSIRQGEGERQRWYGVR